MTEWKRVAYRERCGRCGAMLSEGTPAQFITLPSVRKVKIRCVECVGPAPPDLPEHVVTSRSTKRMQPLQRTAASFTRAKLSDQDWTARILGERE